MHMSEPLVAIAQNLCRTYSEHEAFIRNKIHITRFSMFVAYLHTTGLQILQRVFEIGTVKLLRYTLHWH
jgi:hypothetical protein